MSLAYVTPTQSSVFGFSFQNYTYDSFRENKLMVAYARRLTAKFNLGIHLDYLHLKVDEYGSKNLLTFGIGCNTWIFNNLVLSAYVYNPVSAKLNQDERTPSVFRLGLGYTINEKVLISVETEKNIYFAPSFKFGLSYQAAESLALRCGFRSSPNIFSFGLAYKINKNFTTDLALSNHAYLGMTPALSFNYSLGKEKGE